MTLSFALNVFFVVGIIVHALGNGGPDWPRGMRMPRHELPSQIVDRIASDLAPADGAAFRAAFNSQQPMLDNSDAMVRPAIERMRSALLIEPFDVAAFSAAIRDLQAVHAEFELSAATAAVQAVTALSSDGRRRVAEWHGPPPSPP
ncbi:MAG: periplasmic heavy metal sensor [Azospirillaceae bacterium]|nr:periplasmic heavy metal sensor [Azospirillaceae bacterium]